MFYVAAVFSRNIRRSRIKDSIEHQGRPIGIAAQDSAARYCTAKAAPTQSKTAAVFYVGERLLSHYAAGVTL